MIYVRLCRQNLEPAPSQSPVPEPTVELTAAYDKYPNLDAKQPFDPKVLRQHLDSVVACFGKHMTTELDTLSRETIEQVGEQQYAAIDNQVKKRLQSYGPEWFLCIAVGERASRSTRNTKRENRYLPNGRAKLTRV